MRISLLTVPVLVCACGLARDFDQYNEGVAGSPASAGTAGASAGAGGSSAGAGGTANSGGTSSGGTHAGGGANTGGVAGGGNSGGFGNAAGASSGGTGNTGGTNTGGGTATGGGVATGGTGGGVVQKCGNGKLDEGEECDDGAQVNGDGCSSICRVTCSDLDAKEFVSDGRVHCYVYSAQGLEWAKAVATCAAIKGGHLVTISDSAENNFVGSLATSSARFWIGLTDGQPISSTVDAKYGWITSQALNFTAWLPDEPNHLQTTCPGGTVCVEHRVAMQPSGKWGDRLESETNPFVCEWEPPPSG